MKEIVVISGKGGTGKTSLVASLAALSETPVLADCDVDAAPCTWCWNHGLDTRKTFPAASLPGLFDKCSNCGKCFELCRFEAIIKDGSKQPAFSVDPIACEGCGVCSRFCPEKAIEFKLSINGQWFISIPVTDPWSMPGLV